MARSRSAAETLRAAVDAGQRRISVGERPLYRAMWKPTLDGAVDVTIAELPIIHLFVPDEARVLDGARVLIASALSVDAASFDVALADPP